MINLNKGKSIGQVVYVVEGDETEVNLLRHIFADLLNYSVVKYDKRNNEITYLQSIDNKYSRVFIVPAEYSSLTRLNNSEEYFDLIYRRLSEWNDLRIDDSAIYYVFDRDPKNNKAGIVKGLINQLCNSRGDNDTYLNGLLLLSYPCVESFVLEAFNDDFVSIKGSVVKTYIQGNGYSIDAIDENDLLCAACHMLFEMERIMDKSFDLKFLDDFKEYNLKIFEYEQQLYQNDKVFDMVSLLSLSLIDLGIIEIV